ncbi:MAG: FAD-binding protein, partial [Armatimonadota bacterium]
MVINEHTVDIEGAGEIPVYPLNTIVVGSGAAGLNCAKQLHDLGERSMAVVTSKLGAGTSSNSGSDKQTYYKLGIFGDVADSPMDFARTLTQGGMCHGDTAYCEALGSAPAFFHLARIGVEFPFNEYGAYVGYKTDHDPRQRGTSAGPKTSIQMFGCLLEECRRRGVQIFDGYEVIRLLTDDEGNLTGALALNRERLDEPDHGLTAFAANTIVLATGGPGELFATTVYPRNQVGSHGLALQIGARANNMS